jgi:hypothetical protein
MFGYTTNFGTFDQLSNGGIIEAVGDEILSPYWFRANTSLPVSIRQLSSSHTQDDIVVLRWHNKGSNSATTIFTTAAVDAQSIHPRKEGTNVAAAGTFTPGSGAFGFKIDNEWSDPTKNPPPAENPDDEGHHVRFFVAKDAKGAIIPDSYFMVMDYAGVNYDYNDNVYLISNIRPENA